MSDATPAPTTPLQLALAWLTLLGTFGVVIAGALVNAWQAALSVPTWPLSYGHLLLPEWVGNTFYEQLHRLLVLLSTGLFAGLAWAARRASRRLRRWVLGGLGLLATQVVLGGVVVLWLDPPLVAALHLLLAIAVVVVTGWIVVRLHGGIGAASGLDPTNTRRARRLLVLLLLQLVLGAISRHPPFGQTAFIATTLAHVLTGLLIVVLAQILGISVARRADGGRRLLGAGLSLVALAQLAVGFWVFFVSPEPLDEQWPPPEGFPAAHALHIALATLLVLGCALLWARSARGEDGDGRGRGGRSATASEFHGTPPHPPSRRDAV
ncbi:MAG: hypothetical protein R3244_03980 [Thermoanaerobaculia bacterium]|nr:hypothetical protein [Thermoanaerobaculia bacterium]